MLQELQPEPTTLDIVTALINSKQPEPPTIDDMTAALTHLNKVSPVWMPKHYQDLELAWRTF